MLCIKCGKNQATKTYARVVAGKRREEYYCLACYHKTFIEVAASERAERACAYCGRTAAELKKTSIVGCARCYETLKATVTPMITGMQGMEAHRGKAATSATEKRAFELRCKELLTLVESYRNTGDSERAKSCYDEYNRLTDYLASGVGNGKHT